MVPSWVYHFGFGVEISQGCARKGQTAGQEKLTCSFGKQSGYGVDGYEARGDEYPCGKVREEGVAYLFVACGMYDH